MAETTINVTTDSEVIFKAESIFASQGLDLPKAVDILLTQTVKQNGFPLDIPSESKPAKVPLASLMDCLRGQIIMGDDFDEPLEDFKEYME